MGFPFQFCVYQVRAAAGSRSRKVSTKLERH
jgi:hypothetical protein